MQVTTEPSDMVVSVAVYSLQVYFVLGNCSDLHLILFGEVVFFDF